MHFLNKLQDNKEYAIINLHFGTSDLFYNVYCKDAFLEFGRQKC